jgi:hypothetical protein
MITPTRTIDGYWLTFTEEQENRLHSILLQDGFTPDGAGLKEWILDIIENSEKEDKPDEIKTITDLLYEHPGVITGAGRFAKNVLGNILNKKRRA